MKTYLLFCFTLVISSFTLSSQSIDQTSVQLLQVDKAGNLINVGFEQAEVTGFPQFRSSRAVTQFRGSRSDSYDNPGSAWYSVDSLRVTYDANGNPINRVTLLYDTASSAWVNYAMETLTYDANNNVTEVIEQEWDG